jgi:hypothetical protein
MARDLSNGVLALCLLAVLAVAGSTAPSETRGDAADFHTFLPGFEAGLHRFVNGDATPWSQHLSRTANGSILGGFGGYEIGAQVDARYAWAASQFEESGAKVQVEYLSTVVAGDLAYTVSIERSQVRIRGKAAPIPMALRVTHAFRRENGAWKLLHRHADHNVTKAAP